MEVPVALYLKSQCLRGPLTGKTKAALFMDSSVTITDRHNVTSDNTASFPIRTDLWFLYEDLRGFLSTAGTEVTSDWLNAL